MNNISTKPPIIGISPSKLISSNTPSISNFEKCKVPNNSLYKLTFVFNESMVIRGLFVLFTAVISNSLTVKLVSKGLYLIVVWLLRTSWCSS